MATDARLTETMVDMADCRTTLYYLTTPAGPSALPLRTADAYNELHGSLASGSKSLSDLRPGYSAVIIKEVSPAYENSKYWIRATRKDDPENYWVVAWEKILPLECTLKERIDFVSDGSFNFKVSPLPRLLLYPFGWSTHLSLRLQGEHTLEDLSRFVRYLVNEDCIRIRSSGATPADAISVAAYFKHVASGVRADAFGGNKTNDSLSQHPVLVTTVLAKSGPSPSSQTDDDDEKNLMLGIVKPGGASPTGTFGTHVYQRQPDNPLRFVVADDYGRFIWMEHLLGSKGRKRVWLRCHHNNSVISLVHALHLHELIVAVDGEVKFKKGLPDAVLELVDAAYRQLSSPGYKNASLRAFLDEEGVQGSIKTAVGLTTKKPSS